MDIQNTVSKLLNPIEKNASLIGAGAFILQPTAIPSISESIQRALNGGLHAPEFQNMINWLLAPDNKNFKNAALATIGGYMLKDATGNATVSKLANIAQKAGSTFLMAQVAYGLLYFSTHSPAPPGMTNTSSVESSSIGNRGYA